MRQKKCWFPHQAPNVPKFNKFLNVANTVSEKKWYLNLEGFSM